MTFGIIVSFWRIEKRKKIKKKRISVSERMKKRKEEGESAIIGKGRRGKNK